MIDQETARIVAIGIFLLVGGVFGFCFGYESGKKVGRREALK